MKEQFKKFLVTRRLYKPFCRNLRKCRDLNFDKYMNLVSFPNNYVSDAFEWEACPEEHNFWAGVDKEWEVIVEQERKRYGKQRL